MTPRDYAINLLRDLKDPYFNIECADEDGDFLIVPDNYPYPGQRLHALLVGLETFDDVFTSLSAAVFGALVDRANPDKVLKEEAIYERAASDWGLS